MVTIYLLRHGETAYNADNLLIGGRSSHLPLSEKGVWQAIETGKYFKANRIYFDKVFCSTAVRTMQTLELITQEAVITGGKVVYSDRLQELSQGEWEGKPRAEFYTPECQATILADNRNFKAPGGESQKDVEERMLQFIDEMILQPYDTGSFLIVGHGNAFKCLLRGILDFSQPMVFKLLIDNVSLTKLTYDRDKGWYVKYVNQCLLPEENIFKQ
ncbi:MAG: histidine phosphatase family protein [Prevotellaceae bacterium]|jgi:probable phosphoglycerate mutase|nr:histidine phosphatase family protein [Prevotellaceae bacterium]